MLCVGIDPHLHRPSLNDLIQYGRHVIFNTHPYASAFKINAAFFENCVTGEGFKAIQALTHYVHIMGKQVILDGKRGDIDSTSQVYAKSAYDVLGVDGVTVQASMGPTSVEPFRRRGKKVFVVCAPSCEGASLDSMAIADEYWRDGLVIGAQRIDILKKVKKLYPQAWILIPGIGAQGGSLESIIDLLDERTIVTVSRSWQSAPALYTMIQQRFSDFSKRNGALLNDLFFNAGKLHDGESLAYMAKQLASKLQDVDFDVLFGPPYKGIPLIALVAAELVNYGRNVETCYFRKEVKDHGEGGLLVGATLQDKKVLILDDVYTAGTAFQQSKFIIEEGGGQVVGNAVLVNRSSENMTCLMRLNK